MPTANLQAYKVAANELSSSTKQNNMVQAIENLLNGLDNANLAAAAAIAVSKLAAGTEGQVLKTVSGVPTWAAAGGTVSYGTSLPASPANGDEAILVDSTTNPTYAWRFRFNSTSGKWDFIGGPPIFAEVTAEETTTSVTYTALTTAGPSITLPVAGDYLVQIGCATNSVSGFGHHSRMSYDIGATAAVDADSCYGRNVNSGTGYENMFSVSRLRKKTGLSAVTLTAKYRSSSASVTARFAERWMSVLPIRVG